MKEIISLINQSLQQVTYQFPDSDYLQLSYEQCLFVTDYLFCQFEIDDSSKEIILEHLNKLTRSYKYSIVKKKDFKKFLFHIFSSYSPRDDYIQTEDLVKYIDFKLMYDVEKFWNNFKKDNKHIAFITKEEALDQIILIVEKHNEDFSRVEDVVEEDLLNLHKFVFFQDFAKILVKVAKILNFDKKKYISRSKQNCGCQIF